MRKILIFLVVLVAILAGLVVFLVATTPRQSAGVHVPLGDRERALVAQVPRSAEAFVIIPTAAAFEVSADANPIIRAALASWRSSHPLPRGWMIGGADLVAWKSGREIRYYLDLDPLRALLVRVSGAEVGGAEGPRIDDATLAQIADLASRLPPGDALVVQRASSRDAYPPLERPTATSVKITPTDVLLTSVGAAARDRSVAAEAPAATPFPRSAVISAWFARAPRLVGDLNRLFAAKVSSLLDDGGMISLYDVDMRKLLPRPIGVIALPANPARKAILDDFTARLNGTGFRSGTLGNMLLLSFDDSIDRFQKDSFDPPSNANTVWSARIDPARMIPILSELAENVGFRIVAPRLFRSTRDLDRWIGGLEQAKTIDVADSVDGGTEILRVRIISK